MACVLAVDAGTTGVRTLAFDEEGSVAAVAYRPLTQHFPRPGWVEHDPVEIWDLVRSTLAEVAGRLHVDGTAVAAIGVTNQRETAVAWDRRDGRPLHAAIVWQDRRTTARCTQLADAGHEELVRERTGLVLDPYFSATKFEWLLDEAGVGTTASLALGTLDAWIVWQLTGGAAFATDVTNASRTMLFDITTRRWTDELCALFGIPTTALPEVHPSCGRLGTVSRDAAAAASAGIHGLDGVPVSGVAGDQQAALLGQACVRPGLVKATYGTGSFVLANAGTSCPLPADGLLTTIAWDLGTHAHDRSSPCTTPHDDPSPAIPAVSYAYEGTTFVSGAAIQWLRDKLAIITSAADVGPLAESVPDAGGVVIVPAFTGLGSPWWDPGARAIVTGITRGAGRAQLARAVVDAIAFGVRDMVDAMTRALGEPVHELRADGGASAMHLLLQLQADQLQIPVVRARCTESTALGAAMLAGIAEGVWSLGDVTALWKPDVECRPMLDRGAADLAYAAWQRATERARAWDEAVTPARAARVRL